jgi:hypothetical protein
MHSLVVLIGLLVVHVNAVRATEDEPETRPQKLPVVFVLKVLTSRT